MNIKTPGDIGLTFFCTIPGNQPNNSAVFNNEPQQVFCLQQMINFDHSATDADGDSLSYEFSPALNGASDADIKPIPGPPPFDSVKYSAPYTSQQPISSDIPFSIDPVSGKISGIPNRTGKYVVSVCCKEWRNGQLINTTYREFVSIVGQCTTINSSFTPDVSNDTVLFPGQRIRLHGGNGLHHYWSPGTYVSDSTAENPIAYFPNPGIYKLHVSVVSDSGCSGSNTITIDVIEHSEFAVPNAFSPNGDNVNDVLRPIPVKGSTLITFKIFDRWGKMVYNGGPADPGWNGTYKGTMQDMAVFFWTLEYEDTQGERHTMSGNVTLVR
jgi:gliding motility-associated-like protein